MAVAQENEVNKVGDKSSVPLDTLSLRKLRLRLKETLNAQKVIMTKCTIHLHFYMYYFIL